MSNIENDIKQVLDNNNLPEARASATFNVTSPKGFGVLVTIRSTDEGEMFDLIDSTEKFLSEKGFTAEVKRSNYPAKPAPVVVEGEKCPECGSALVKFTSKDGTKSGVKCSTAKWDFITKTSSGCSFVRFDGSSNPVDIVSEEATSKQVFTIIQIMSELGTPATPEIIHKTFNKKTASNFINKHLGDAPWKPIKKTDELDFALL